MSENKGLQGLEAQVMNRDLCTLCGACSGLCPYLRPWQGRMAKLHDCDLKEGRCFAYCPRTAVDLNGVHQAVFGRGYEDLTMGPVGRVLIARSKDRKVRRRAQTGGVVSTLMDVALREGFVQAAVLTQRERGHLPKGLIARSREEILTCAGSSYVAGPTLEAFNRGPWDGVPRIGLVGLPCQVLAVGKMRAANLERHTPIDRISLVVGLFCTWALTYEPFLSFIKARVNGRPAMDFVLDTGAAYGDAALTLPVAPHPVGPTSTAIGAAILQALMIAVMERLAASGEPVVNLPSSNVPDADVRAVLGEVERYRGRIRHL